MKSKITSHLCPLIKWVGGIFIFLFFCNFAFAMTVEEINPTDYVTDYTNTLTVEEVLELSKKLGELERAKKIPVAVVMVDKLTYGNSGGVKREEYIERFAVKLFEKLKIGDKKKDEGLLWLIVKDERIMRFEVGYGLEGVLADGVTKNIQDNFVRAEFKNNNYFNGIENGINKVIEVVAPELLQNLTEEKSSLSGGGFRWGPDLFVILIFLFVILINTLAWGVAILGRTKEWYAGGIVAFIIGFPILFFGFGLNLIGDIILFIFVLTGFLFDFFVSKNYKYWEQRLVNEGNKHGPDWWAGGVWAPGSNSWTGRGGSGFGGFGGGGMSGGGGSNSSW